MENCLLIKRTFPKENISEYNIKFIYKQLKINIRWDVKRTVAEIVFLFLKMFDALGMAE